MGDRENSKFSTLEKRRGLESRRKAARLKTRTESREKKEEDKFVLKHRHKNTTPLKDIKSMIHDR